MKKTTTLINLESLDRIIYNAEILHKEGKLSYRDPSKQYKKVTDFKAILTYFLNLRILFNDNGEAHIKYQPSASCINGRLFSVGPSLQGISKHIRATISMSDDFDIENCHPRFLPDLCKNYDLPFNYIQDYIINRESYLTLMVNEKIVPDRDQAKNLLLKVMNGGSPDKFKGKNEKLVGLVNEFITILNNIKNILPDHYANAVKYKRSGYNVEGTALNYYLCEKENEVLTKITDFCNKKKWKIDTLCFDGILLRGFRQSPLEVASMISSEIGIKVVHKPMIKNIIDMEGLPYNQTEVDTIIEKYREKCENDGDIDIDTLYMATKFSATSMFGDAFYELCPINDRFVYIKLKSGGYWYECPTTTNIWSETSKPSFLYETIRQVLTPLLTERVKALKGDSCKKIKKEYMKAIHLVNTHTQVVSISNSLCSKYIKDQTEFEYLLNANTDLIAFNNGVFNLKTRQFRQIEAQDYISVTTLNSFDTQVNQDNKQFIMDTYNNIFSTEIERDYVLQSIALALLGKNTLQKFFVWNGAGSNGKSVIKNQLEKLLGGYLQTIDIKNFTGDDDEKSDLVKAMYARIVFSSEPKKSSIFNESLIKLITGNDSISKRLLFDNTKTFKCRFMLFLLCNTIPSGMDDNGMRRRVSVIPFNNQFVDKPTKPNEKLRDDQLDSKLISMTNDLFHILVDYIHRPLYTIPNTFIQRTKEYIQDTDELSIFLSHYEHTSNTSNKFISFDTLRQTFNHNHKPTYLSRHDFRTQMNVAGYTTELYKKKQQVYYLQLVNMNDDERMKED